MSGLAVSLPSTGYVALPTKLAPRLTRSAADCIYLRKGSSQVQTDAPAKPTFGENAMPLTFPNISRSFDKSRNGVRFSGYDGMFEVRFLIEANALRTTSQACRSEAECLSVFDASRTAILKAAAKAYGRGGKDRYTLSADDIRR